MKPLLIGWKILQVSIAVFTSLCASVAQSPYRFHQYTRKDGLASDLVWSLKQDSLGFIWAQYQGALSRFDGYNFKIYSHDAGDPSREMLDFYFGRLEGGNGHSILVPNHKEVNGIKSFLRYETRKDGFVEYQTDSIDNIINQYVYDNNGTVVWLGTGGIGLYHFDFTTQITTAFANTVVRGQENAIVGLKDLGPSLLLGTYRGLWLFDKERKSFSRPKIQSQDTSFLYSGVTRIIPNREPASNTWLRIDRHLIKIDSAYKVIHSFELPQGVFMGLKKVSIDLDDVIWFGGLFDSKTGIYRYDPRDTSLVNIKHDPADPHSLASNIVYDILIDRDQNIWVGTDHGISVLRKKDVLFHNTNITDGTVCAIGLINPGLNEKLVINKMVTGGQMNFSENLNQLMIGTVNSGQSKPLEFSPLGPPIQGGLCQSIVSGKETLWVPCLSSSRNFGGIYGYDLGATVRNESLESFIKFTSIAQNENTLRSNLVGRPWEDKNGNLFVPVGGSIDVINRKLPYGSVGSVTHFKGSANTLVETFRRDDQTAWFLDVDTRTLSVISQDTAYVVTTFSGLPYTIQHSENNSLLVGTQNELLRADEIDGKFRVLSLKKFKETEINAIQNDQLGRIWIYANSKLICYDSTNNSVNEFDEDDGLLHIRSFHMNWLLKTSDGLMITAGPDGITYFDPTDFKLDKKEINPVLTKLSINNVVTTGIQLPGDPEFKLDAAISKLDELILDYWHNNFAIDFSAMEMTAPSKNLYRHKLDDYDKDWIETDYKSRTATYTNLPSGTYTFRVKASNHHGVWSDNERTLKVIILPPPWRTWWPYSCYGLLVTGLLVWARRNIVQRERLKSNLKLEHLELEKAKEVDKVKTSFFTNISHEFRTPLTLIKGPVQSMIEQFVSDQQEVDRKKIIDQLKLIQRNSDLLLKLINQLLDLAKLESGTLKVEKSEGEVFSFVRAVASSFESMARQKGITLVVDVPAESQPAVFDKDKLETILINLVNNAIKFTGGGGTVSVEARCRNSTAETQRRKELELIVRDTGIGIPAEHQSKIFERFHQVSEAHKEVGTGIGLALVKELVTLMNGTISVNSEPGKGLPDVALSKSGSEFVVEIPIEEVTSYQPVHESFSAGGLPVSGGVVDNFEIDQPETGDRQPATEHNLHEDGQTAKPHILVVEDNTDLRKFIIDSLGGEFSFLEAENGVEGLEKAMEGIPDMIISDVMMPEMDGITMAGKIREQTLTGHIPIILLTARSTEASKISGLRSGADDYLTKPFNKEELLLKVRNRISRQQKLREKLRAELMGAAPKVSVLSEDERFLQTVKEKILERLGDEQLSVESLAEEIGLSRVQLYRKVSGLTDMSVNELIRKLRLQRAAQLLAQQWGPVSQVAYEVGFSNLSYFSKVFKEEFGVLPSEYEETI